MKILLIGGGGREHALAWRLAGSPRTTGLYAAPGSAAIGQFAQCVDLEGHDAIARFAEAQGIGLALVGPEAPLVAGLADALRARGVPTFGPSQAAARLEGSKVFAKAFMARHGIPTAAHASFSDLAQALAYVERRPGRFVVKADGLAAGKGVIVCADPAAGREALQQIMAQRAFGDSGAQVVVEDFLEGEEASFFAITDGRDFVTLPSCQDHKPIFELDRGPNTGGMGAYCPAPVVTPEVEQSVIERIVRPTLAGMEAEGHPFQGVLYVGLMIEQGQPWVVEYNCRFGDPECQPLMMLLKSDLVDLLEAAAQPPGQGALGRCKVSWHDGAAACIVMASAGYPGPPITGQTIEGLESLPETDQARVFHSGTRHQGGIWTNTGGRVLGVTARDVALDKALARAYRLVERIHWPGAQFRRDIGLKGLLHGASLRPAISLALVAQAGGDPALGESVLAGSVLHRAAAAAAELGLQCRLISADRQQPRQGAPLEAALREASDAGAEVILTRGPGPWPAEVARLTPHPVIAWQPGPPAPGLPPAIIRAQGSLEQAVLLAAQLLALKYPDVQARLQLRRLEQEAAARAGD